jgi:transcriptional regulator with XRE-family HTH domain
MHVKLSPEKVRELREEREMSHRELAEVAGVSASTLANLERGANVRLKTARKVGAALGVDPRSLRRSASRA